MIGPTRLAVGVALATALVACGGSASGADVRLRVDNDTDTPVGVYLDGTWMGTDEPGATIDVPLGAGSPPLLVEVRSPSGATLATLEAQAGPVQALRDGDAQNVIAQEFGVPCGVIRIVIGELGTDRAPAPAPSVAAGPCP